MRPRIQTIFLAALILLSDAVAAAPGDPVGSATKVVNKVTAEFAATTRDLATGDGVRQDELIEVEANGLGEIKLNDDTKLALGPGSRLKLDKFVYDPDKNGGAISVDLLKGAFRFITGKAAKPSYLIRSPNASISVRGTIFDAYIDALGNIWLLLHEGEIEVCNAERVCRILSDPCSLLRVGSDGSLGEPATLDRQSRGLDTDFASAFPFITTPPDFDPVVRFTRASIETGSCAGPRNLQPRLQRADLAPPSTPPDDTGQQQNDTPPETGPIQAIPGVGLPIYIRIDLNVNTSSNPPRVEEEGLVIDDDPEVLRGISVESPVSISPGAIDQSFDGRGSFGLGLGIRLPGGFRFEITGDRRHQTSVSIDSVETTEIRGAPANFSLFSDVEVTTRERTDIDGGVFMASVYMDIPLGGPFTAFIGGGAGLAWTHFDRENTTSTFATGAGRVLLYTNTVSQMDNRASFAGALAGGLGYWLTDFVELELGYRFVHIEGTEGDLETAGTTSALSIDDANQHEVRIGVRLGAN